VAPGILISHLAAEVPSPPVKLVPLLTKWQTGPFSLAATVIVVCLGAAYLVGVRRLASRGRRWSPLRTLSFLLGVLAVVLGLGSGVAYYSNRVFYVHTVQHVMLMNAAAILFALGGPMTLWLQASSRPLQKRLLRVLHSKAFEIATFPVLVASVSYVVMIVYFLSPLYVYSEQHEPFLDFVNASIVFSGCLYWWPVVGLDPSRWKLSFPAKLGYLATGIPVTTFLGLGLISTTTSIDPAIHTLADTHAGGGALWVLSELFTLGAMGAVLVQLMHSEERAAARYDRSLMHEQANLEREAELAAERSAQGASQVR
jgi:cytochrome c oxidase assembly factor CtaG